MTLSHTIKLLLVGPDPETSLNKVVDQKPKNAPLVNDVPIEPNNNMAEISFEQTFHQPIAQNVNVTEKPIEQNISKSDSPTKDTNNYKPKKPAALDSSVEKTIDNTISAKVFFSNYNKIIDDLKSANRNAAAEMMFAQKDMRTRQFIDRTLTTAKKKAAKERTAKQKINYIDKVVDSIRVYNDQITVDTRAHLAINKRKIIAELTETKSKTSSKKITKKTS